MAKGKKPAVNVGDKFTSNTGEEYTVTDYVGSSKGVTIKFISTGNSVLCSAKEVKSGSIKNVLQKSVYGVGCFGEGKYKAKVGGKFTPEYQVWIGMMTRVYEPRSHVSHPTYSKASVCNGWLNFQNFATWCQTQQGFNTAEPNGRAHHLDKDVLIPNNLEYGPEACCFITHQVNIALKGRQLDKTTDLPCGVYWHKAANSYVAQIQKESLQYHLGCFPSVDSARQAYRKEKREYIAYLAEKQRHLMCEAAYVALININLDERTEYEYA